MISLILILLLGIGALFIPIPTVRFLLILLSLIRGWSLLSQKITPRFIVIKGADYPHFAHCNSPFQVPLLMKNCSPFPLSYLTVHQDSGELINLDHPKKVLSLGPFEEREIVYNFKGERRGHYTLGPVVVSGTDMFRIATWKNEIRALPKIMIYPELFDVDLKHKSGIGGGSIRVTSPLYEDMTRFDTLREYRPGDELRRINWKASARFDKLHTTEYQNRVDSPVHIILNLSADEYPLTHRKVLIERAVRVTSSLCSYFISMGQRVSFLSSGTLPSQKGDSLISIHGAKGDEQAAQLLGVLAGIRGNPKGLSLIELLSDQGNPRRKGTKNLVIGPPPLTADSDYLYEQIKMGREIEYFMITARKNSSEGGAS